MTGKQRLIVVAGLAISVIFLGVAFYKLKPDEVWGYIKQANPLLLIFAVFWYFTSVTGISIRWQSLLNATKPVKLGELFRLVCVTYMGNNVYPLRSGEVIRVILLQRDEGVPLASGGIVAITERVFDGIVMLTFVLIGVLTLNVTSPDLRNVALVTAPIFIIALVVFFVLALRPNILRRLVALIARLLPGRLRDVVTRLGEEVIEGLEGLRTPRDLAKTVFWSYACWMLEASTYWIVSFAFNLNLPYPAAMLVVGVVNLAGLIPASPGGFGVYEFFGVLALGAVGIDQAKATAFILVNHLVIWLPVTLVGFYILFRRGLSVGAVTNVDQLEKGSSSPMKIAIIGAGASGMAAAWDLIRAGHEVTLYEAEARVGGLAGGFKDAGWDWWLEKFYHHWFESDTNIFKIAEEMGVRDKIIFPRPKTSYWINGKVVRSEISPQTAISLPLPPLDKARFLFGGGLLKLTPYWKPLEKVTADEWMRRYMGEAGYDKFFKPLLIGKFGDEYDKVNMAWMWARVHSRSLKLGIFEGGFQAFLDTLGAAITEKGAKISLNTPVERIGFDNGTLTLTVKGETIAYDRILATTSPKLLLKLAPQLGNTHYGDAVADLRSIGGLCVVVAIKQQLLTDGTYWLNLPATSPDKKKSRFPFLALVEHTNFMDKAHYGGDHILYCGDYVPANHEYFRISEDDLAERFTSVLSTFNRDFKPDWIRKTWVFRAPYAQPIPYRNQSERIPALETPLPGLFWASMSQVYPWDRGTNYAVEIGRRAAAEMVGEPVKTD